MQEIRSSSKEHNYSSPCKRETMLVHWRSLNESIIMGDDITVTVFVIDGHNIRNMHQRAALIGAYRHEVYAAISTKNNDT